MPILLPNLDDRRWADLVEEGRALIPLYAPEWTDHNVHDPGITLVELFAWLAEMDIFQLNRITDQAKLKFLSLIGIHPEPPQPAATVLSFSLAGGSAISLPAQVEFAGADPFGQATWFLTPAPINVIPAALAAVQVKDSAGFHDMTDRWRRGLPFGAFGDIPAPGSEVYLGFDKPLAAAQAFRLYFSFAGAHATPAERRRIIAEAAARTEGCKPPILSCKDVPPEPTPARAQPAGLPPYQAVRTAWELMVAPGQWIPLSGGAVADDTRDFTLDGAVVVTPPGNSRASQIGKVAAALSYLRARFEAGAYDAPPVIETIAMNAVPAAQAVPVGELCWTIAKGVVASPSAPPDPQTGLQFAFNSAGEIVSLSFVTGLGLPQFRILTFTAATATAAGLLSIEAVRLGIGDGTPFQQMALPQAPAIECGFELLSLEGGQWHAWRLRRDFDASRRNDRDFLLDPAAGTVTFGSGDKGLALPAGAVIIAAYLATRTEAGNLRPGAVNKLVDSPHNRAILTDFGDVKGRLIVTNPVAAAGGAAAETLSHAMGRAIAMLGSPQRAITLSDYETLAREVPGVDVGRVKAWPDHHPSFPCFKAPGVITVVVLPNMPVSRPIPSPALRGAVAAYLDRRRIVGTRIFVVGPTYREVAVQAQVQSLAGSSKTALTERIVAALNNFLNPLTGGPDGTGWPFGRDVYRAEILRVIAQVPGVDYVVKLALFSDGCECSPQCGNVCLAPTWLVMSGQHQIEVL